MTMFCSVDALELSLVTNTLHLRHNKSHPLFHELNAYNVKL